MKLQERLDALTERENPWPLVRFGAKWLLVIFALGIGLRIVCAPLFYAGKAAQVAAEQIDPRALLAKYEWFKDAHASLDRFHANIKVYRQRERGVLKAYGADRYRWPAPERERYDQWESELAGVTAAYNDLAAQYNAQMAKINYRFTNVGDLPPGATEPLPRGYAPYAEGDSL